jgi:hypothetical protein
MELIFNKQLIHLTNEKLFLIICKYLKKNKEVYSVAQGKRYEIYSINNDKIYFKRKDSKNPDKIHTYKKNQVFIVIDKVKKISKINTDSIKNEISGKQSPILSFLKVSKILI